MTRYPELPILPSAPSPPSAPRRSIADRYGALFVLSLAGLFVLTGLIAWFSWSVWGLRNVWEAIYVLNDPARPVAERIAAAQRLATNPAVTPRQLWDLALSRVPPDQARYLLAEALTDEAIAADPNGYALAVARSQGWPAWLRVLLIRPLAYGADSHPLPKAPLDELSGSNDPILALWAAYARAAGRDDPQARATLQAESHGDHAQLATILLHALDAPPRSNLRRSWLDAATAWLRDHHPEARRLWEQTP
ncbi:MAG: hypothetical protein KatS3mg108_2091 [Isosphaeraceae bacterium]|jgi:hypothetical protein|nr:MAG: hypothetical protein KatS3mg108_2091 [Isosphaeraceae bacterium]